jgi:tetratricopeptide (TPR) repeat protein
MISLAAVVVAIVATPTLCLGQNESAEAAAPFEHPESSWIEIDGEVFGAKPPDENPIGGGEGYNDIFTSGDITVATADEFKAALSAAEAGQVIYVPDGVEIDLTGEPTLSIPGGVTLAGSRGHQGSPGALIKRLSSGTMLSTGGDEVRVTGLRFEGAYSGTERVAMSAYFLSVNHFNVEVDNNEIYSFNVSGVGVGPSAMATYIHHNFMHHIWKSGLGYPVSTSASDTRIIANRFNMGRHHIASSGSPGSGYEFAHNWIGPEAIGHHVDMHGGRDRGDGTDIAGDWMHVHHNTFQGTVQPVRIRGVPSQGAWIHNNWFHLAERGSRVVSPWPVGGETNVHLYDNAYGAEQPMLLDVEFAAFADAFDAARTAFRSRRFQQARVWFERAAELAATDSERAEALLQIGHTQMSQDALFAARHLYEEVLTIEGADQRVLATARNRLRRIERREAERPEPEWELAFEDDFSDGELSDDWEPLLGTWSVEDGALRSGAEHSEIVIARPFEGLHRFELEITTPANTVRPCDFSPAIHSTTRVSPGQLHASGYFLQFGGAGNTLNRILRAGEEMQRQSLDYFIKPGHVHEMVAEFDGTMVRLTVDGITVMEAPDDAPLLGRDRTTVGLVTYNVAHVRSVRVYTAEPM